MLRNTSLICLFAVALILPSFTQAAVTFNHQIYNGSFYNTQVDLNGDGIPDFIGYGPKFGQFQVTLSNANGTYQSPVVYNTIRNEPFSSFVAADFNGDNHADLVVVIDGSGTSTGPGYEVFLGNGTGTLSPPKSKVSIAASLEFAVTSDFNHDNKLDLAFGAALGSVWLALGHGDGTFSAPTQVFNAGGSFEHMLTGDFDGDGNADLAIRQDVCNIPGVCYLRIYGLFGNGKGSFTNVVTNLPASESYVGPLTTYDLNKDGRSDLLGPGGDQSNPFVMVAYGNATRKFNVKIVPAGISPDNAWPNYLTLVAAADLNGDGLNDIIYSVIQQATSSTQIGYNLGQAGGGFGPTNLYAYGTYSDGATGGALVGDYNRDRKPDVALTDGEGTTPIYTIDLLLNTSSGNFPKCSAPAPVGIHVCKPGTTSGSAVAFSVAASSFTPIRKIEIWIDGAKRSETYNSLVTQSFVDTTFKLTTGSHRADIYAAGYDNMLQHKGFTFTVQ